MRGKGTGSVFRPKGARYFWVAWWGHDETGKRKRHYEATRSTRKGDAQRVLDERLGDRARGVVVTPQTNKVTFAEAAKAVVDDFTNNGKRSVAVVRRRIVKHLMPYFRPGRLMATIAAGDVAAFVAKRKADAIVTRKARVDEAGNETPAETRPVSNAEVNRELQTLKRMFNLAVEQEKLTRRPVIKLLTEDNVRKGFFEPEQLAAVVRRLPEPIRPVVLFAAVTGWRVASEVLSLEWRNVDFAAGEVRLDPGVAKNKEGRTFPMTADLRALLEAQLAEHDRMKAEDKPRIVPWVFHRDGERIVSFLRAWHTACREAGVPGKIPHDLRRTAVRNFVRNGISANVAMKLSGHKTPSVFRRYDIVSDGDLRDAAARLDAAQASLQAGARG